MIQAVDLFCGAGGLTHGLQQAGIKVNAGFDIEASCRYAYEHNNKTRFIESDIRELTAQEVTQHFKANGYTLLAGCAPCQPFSTYSRSTKKSKFNNTDDRWDLLSSFGRIIAEVLPDFVTMENVPGITEQSVFSEFLNTLDAAGYNTDYKVVFCPDYGMAQTRKRLVLVASRINPIELIPATHTPENYITVADVIQNLPPLSAGETDRHDPLHRCSRLNEVNLERIKQSVPGGSWMDWPQELRAGCHQKDSGKTYPSVYGRMSWDQPAPTITTQCNGFGNGRFGHPEQDRAISLREAALLQSFPRNYQFTQPGENCSIQALAKMIGNAVPVRLGEVVGISLLNSLNNRA